MVRRRFAARVAFPLLLLLLSVFVPVLAGAGTIRVGLEARFDSQPIRFDALGHTTAAGQRISITRLDLLLSDFALRETNGQWRASSNRFAYISTRDTNGTVPLTGLPRGTFYDRIRFHVGVPPAENHANPGTLSATHPLNPNVNGLHWNWQGGYVFLALEGRWGEDHGYSFHLATDPLLMTVELPVPRPISSDEIPPVNLLSPSLSSTPSGGEGARRAGEEAPERSGSHVESVGSSWNLSLSLDVAGVLAYPHCIILGEDTASTHSRDGDVLALQLRDNIERAFRIESIGTNTGATRPPGNPPAAPLIAAGAAPHRFTFPSYLPQPALPPDNPLTDEGIDLGRRLFSDVQLSSGNRQSCASCHQPDAAFVDRGRRFSVGAEGHTGSRNAMPLLNLAWRSTFFWDGRAPSLRVQVLQPIENPIELHESLPNVVAKLTTLGAPFDYPAAFAAAFGSREISSDRIARALEQFLISQVSHGSRLDRSLAGQSSLTAEEQRGFELFHTEYDPRRGQFGADCFHCHGGPLFQSQAFANNGLDAVMRDPGRSTVTGREGDRGKFAVPSLRNVAVTAPYMHDGRFETLEEVVEHYATGVKRNASLDPNLAKHPDGGIPLSPSDQRALVAFLRTLTDERFAPAGTARAP